MLVIELVRFFGCLEVSIDEFSYLFIIKMDITSVLFFCNKYCGVAGISKNDTKNDIVIPVKIIDDTT